MSTQGERLREERQRLGMNQDEFAGVGGVQRRAQVNYEKDERHPDSAYLAAIAQVGADVQYIITGQRSEAGKVRVDAHFATQQAIDGKLVQRIWERLDMLAAAVGKRWTPKAKLSATVAVYNYLVGEEATTQIDDAKVDRTLRLVINN